MKNKLHKCNAGLFSLEPKWPQPFRFVSNLSHTMIDMLSKCAHAQSKAKSNIAIRKGLNN